MPNVVIYFKHRSRLDDIMIRLALIGFTICLICGYQAGVTASLIASGTVVPARTKREEQVESMCDNDLEEYKPADPEPFHMIYDRMGAEILTRPRIIKRDNTMDSIRQLYISGNRVFAH